jgi:hypothetical protein
MSAPPKSAVFSPLVRPLVLNTAADYHLFIRLSQKTDPPAIRASILTTANGQISFSVGSGKATFIEKILMTRLASIIATVQMVNFLMS